MLCSYVTAGANSMPNFQQDFLFASLPSRIPPFSDDTDENVGGIRVQYCRVDILMRTWRQDSSW